MLGSTLFKDGRVKLEKRSEQGDWGFLCKDDDFCLEEHHHFGFLMDGIFSVLTANSERAQETKLFEYPHQYVWAEIDKLACCKLWTKY